MAFPRIDSVLGLAAPTHDHAGASTAALEALSQKIGKAIKGHKRAKVRAEEDTGHLRLIADSATALANATKDPEEQWNEYAVTVGEDATPTPRINVLVHFV